MRKALASTLVLSAMMTAAMFGDTATAKDTLQKLNCSENEIAKFDGNAWVCAADNTAPVLVDANGHYIGPVLQFGFDLSGFFDSGHTGPLVVGVMSDALLAPVKATREGFSEHGELFFESLDCTGQAYATGQGVEGFFPFPIVLGPQRTLYVNEANVPGTISVRSILRAGEQCVLETFTTGPVRPATPLLDLAVQFTPPFHLTEQYVD